MTPRTLLAMLLGLGVAAAWSTARADDPWVNPAEIFERFDHRKHADVIASEHLGCPACHQVGGRVPGDTLPTEDLDAVFLLPPPGACHYCHNPQDGRQPIAPQRCDTCHERVPPPSSHGAGWMDAHGPEARLGTLTCNNCHRETFCVDCHQRRQPEDFKVHDRTWISVHGIAARTQPDTCGTCHLQVDCLTCHTTGDGRL